MLFKRTERFNKKEFIGNLSGRFRLKIIEKREKARIFFDTFDWRAAQNGLVLQLGDNNYLSVFDNKFNVLSKVKINLINGKFLAKDVRDQSLRSKLFSISPDRAFYLRAKVKSKVESYELRDKYDKLTGIITFENIVFKEKAFSEFEDEFVVSLPLKGYEKLVNDEIKRASKRELRKVENPFIKIFLENYALNKPSLDLSRVKSLDEAIKRILSYLYQSAGLNEWGIKADIDIEFLHYYRVSIRKSKTLLKNARKYLDGEKTAKLNKFLSFAGSATSALRDYDVYLARENEYKEMLPVKYKNHIDPVFKKIKTLREKERKLLVKKLSSNLYNEIRTDYEETISNLDLELFDKTAPDIEIFIEKTLQKKFNSIVKYGRALNSSSPPEAYHALRIKYKEFRYILELFSSSMPAGAADETLASLKAIQDQLGAFQDLSVQREELESFLKRMNMNTPSAKNAILAVGCLIGEMDRNQRNIAEEFLKNFVKFMSEKNKKRIMETLKIR